jgi:UDP-glucose 4-epimerase
VREVIAAVEKASGKKVKVKLAPRRAGDPPGLYADNRKAVQELGWKIEYPTLDSIVETAWRWHRAHPKGYDDKKKTAAKTKSRKRN